MGSMDERTLRELVETRLNVRWQEWAQQHPNLASVLDRTRLIDKAVQRLSERADYQQAMQDAAAKRQRLEEAAGLVERVDAVVGELLPW